MKKTISFHKLMNHILAFPEGLLVPRQRKPQSFSDGFIHQQKCRRCGRAFPPSIGSQKQCHACQGKRALARKEYAKTT